jgi:DNA-directed RNA polymerase subunit RPC12/RpoP
MKCLVCRKGKMKTFVDRIPNEKIDFEFYRCLNCGEEILDMQQLKVLANKYKRLRKAKEITFSKWGNSIAVRIPNDIVKNYKIKSGKHGTIIKEKEGIKIIPS